MGVLICANRFNEFCHMELGNNQLDETRVIITIH